MLKRGGKAPVCIELDRKAHALELGAKVGNIGLKQRLAARDAYAVQHAATLMKKSANLVQIHGGKPLAPRHHERRVVAKRTAEIASGTKQRSRHVLRKIQQCELLQSRYAHALLLFRAASPPRCVARRPECVACRTPPTSRASIPLPRTKIAALRDGDHAYFVVTTGISSSNTSSRLSS